MSWPPSGVVPPRIGAQPSSDYPPGYVHASDSCGGSFESLAAKLDWYGNNRRFDDMYNHVSVCYRARLEDAARHGGVDAAHVAPTNLVRNLGNFIESTVMPNAAQIYDMRVQYQNWEFRVHMIDTNANQGLYSITPDRWARMAGGNHKKGRKNKNTRKSKKSKKTRKSKRFL